MKKILVTVTKYSEFCPKSKALLEKEGFQIDENTSGKRYTEQQLMDLVADYDAAIVGMDPWTSNVIQNANKLKIIAKFGVGYDNIDISAASKNNIIVTYAKGQNAQSVAELALTLMLDVLKKVSVFNSHIRKGQWDRDLQFELQGKTVGLYGFGNIAQALARLLQGFQTRVIAYDPYFNASIADSLSVTYVKPDQLLQESDIVSLHLPGFVENTHIISEKELAKMKDNAILINTSRGNLVDLKALEASLKSGKLAGAGLDCFEAEPVDASSGLFACENVVATPHCGGKTWEAYERIGESTAQNILDVFQGKNPKNRIGVESK